MHLIGPEGGMVLHPPGLLTLRARSGARKDPCPGGATEAR
jgi:hypothetical protein